MSERIARIAALERFDLHRELSQRVPVIAIARLIGVPEEDEARFAHWAAPITLRPTQSFQPCAAS